MYIVSTAMIMSKSTTTDTIVLKNVSTRQTLQHFGAVSKSLISDVLLELMV